MKLLSFLPRLAFAICFLFLHLFLFGQSQNFRQDALLMIFSGTTVQKEAAAADAMALLHPIERRFISSVRQELVIELWRISGDGIVIDGISRTDVHEIADIINSRLIAGLYYAEPDFTFAPAIMPSDPLYNQQWGFPKVKADLLPAHVCGTLAVIDSGTDWKHPDLVNNIWQNLGEDADGDGHVLELIGNTWQFDIGDVNGIDNDGNGFADDFVGWDFVNHDNNPMDDSNGSHGTHVAGIIGAQHNSIGVAGICNSVEIAPLKFINAQNSGYTSDAIAAINYAVSNGFKVSNNSWGGASYSVSLYQTLLAAQTLGHLFVAAAGNDALNIDVTPFYPASYNLDNIVSVGASNITDMPASFSNYGASGVDIFAPGVGILSTVASGSYAPNSGTSMAAPFVTGLSSMLWANCSSLNYASVKNLLIQYADAAPALLGKCVANGRMNANAAFNNSSCCSAQASFTYNSAGTVLCQNDVVTFTAAATGASAIEWRVNGVLASSNPVFEFTFTGSGSFDISLTTYAGSSCSSVSSQNFVVNAVLIPAFTYSLSGLFCQFYVEAGNYSYLWTFGDGSQSSLPNPSHVYAGEGNYTVCLTTSSGNCGSATLCNQILIQNCTPVWNQIGYDNAVFDILSDGDFYWAATSNGLYRVHKTTGNQTYFSALNSGLQSMAIYHLELEAPGVLWIGSGGGLTRFDSNTNVWENFANNGYFHGDEIWGLSIDHSTATVWTSCNWGFDKMYIPTRQLTDFSAIGWTNNFWTCMTASNGFLWLWDHGKIIKYNGIDTVEYADTNLPLSSTYKDDFVFAPDGNSVWVAGTQGVASLNLANNTWNTFYDNPVRAVAFTNDGHIWIATNLDIFEWNGSSFVNHINGLNSIDARLASTIVVDENDNVLIGTRDGMYRLDRNADIWVATHFTQGNQVPYSRCSEVCKDAAGNLYFATDSELTVHRTDGSWEHFWVPLGHVVRVYADTVWVGCQDGVFYMPLAQSQTSLSSFTTANGLPSNNISDFCHTNSGVLYAATPGGLGKYAGGTWSAVPLPAGFSQLVNALCVSQNMVWAGTDNGLGRLNLQTNLWEVIDASMNVRDIVTDTISHDVYVSNENKVFRFPGGGLPAEIFSNQDAPYRRMAFDYADNSIWCNVYWNGTFHLKGTHTVYYSLENSELPYIDGNAIYIDNQGTRYFCSGAIATMSGCTNEDCPLDATFSIAGGNTLCAYEPAAITITNPVENLLYQWQVNNNPVGMGSNFAPVFAQGGIFTLTLIVSDGSCSVSYAQSITIEEGCVWPGDCTYDGTVNMDDWLLCSFNTGESGGARPDASVAFTAQPANDFANADYPGNFFNTVNPKHSDCDGNGIVAGEADADVVLQNFGHTRPTSGFTASPVSQPDVSVYWELLNAASAANDTAVYRLNISNPFGGPVNVYGISIQIQHNGNIEGVDFSNTVFGTPSQLSTGVAIDTAQGLLSLGICRKTGTDIAANGKVVDVEISPDVSETDSTLLLSAIQVAVINSNGYVVSQGAGQSISTPLSSGNMGNAAGLFISNVFLEGALPENSSGSQLMSTNLADAGLLPFSQPFNTLPWLYQGAEFASSIPANAVDWLLLELRDAQYPQSILARKAVWLLNDGSIQDVNALQPGLVQMPAAVTNTWCYLVLRHRNHIAVMSSQPVAVNAGQSAYYSFAAADKFMGGTTQVKQIGSLVAMRSGDVNADGVITHTDGNLLFGQSGVNVYSSTDCNQDGMITTADFNTYRVNSAAIGISLIRY